MSPPLRLSLLLVLLVLLSWCALGVQHVCAETVFAGFRALQYDRVVSRAASNSPSDAILATLLPPDVQNHDKPVAGDALLLQRGPRKTLLSLPVVPLSPQEVSRLSTTEAEPQFELVEGLGGVGGNKMALRESRDPRRIAVVSVTQLSRGLLGAFSNGQVGQALLVLLPEGVTSTVTVEDAAAWHGLQIDGSTPEGAVLLQQLAEVESALVGLRMDYPLYFAAPTQEQREELMSGSSGLTLVVHGTEPTAAKVDHVVAVESWLYGSKGRETPSSVALVSHMDSLGVVPGLAQGLDSNVGSTVALLETQRALHKLVVASKTRATHSMLFLLTSGGRLNYAGTQQWLARADQNVLETLQFALCLEDLTGEKLKLHVSRSPQKDAVVHRVNEVLSQLAQQQGIPFELVHRKVKPSALERSWEHEHFAFKKVAAGTLSSSTDGSLPQFLRSHMFSSIRAPALFQRNLRFVREAAAALAFELTPASPLLGGVLDGVNDAFVDAWTVTLRNSSTTPLDMVAGSPLVESLAETCSTHAERSKLHKIKVDALPFTFYQANTLFLSLYSVTSMSFQFVLFCVTLLFMAAIIVYLKGFQYLKTMIVDFVRGPKPRAKEA